MPLIRHFWGWDSPVTGKAVAELGRGWSRGDLDLSQILVVVPTSEAARRLREALAVAASEKNGAVCAPFVWHPEAALARHSLAGDAASGLQERLAWAHVLQRASLSKYKALFPQPPEEVSPDWISSVAETLRALRHTLGAGGYGMEDVRSSLTALDSDRRWQELAILEKAFLQTLRERGLQDAQQLKRAVAHSPVLPDGANRVLVFAVPDPPPLFRTWLETLAAALPVEIYVQAPESEAGKFDALGTPLTASWGDGSRVVLPMPADFMHPAAGPEDQARRAAALLGVLSRRGCGVAVGSCDPALNGVLEGTLDALGARVFNPAGRSARQHVMVQVLRDGWRARHQPSWRAWLPFLHHNDVLDALGDVAKTSPEAILGQLDDFHATHLPATLDDALRLSAANVKFNGLHAALAEIVKQSEAWGESSCESAVRTFLGWIYGRRDFDPSRESDRHFGDLFSAVLRLAVETDSSHAGVESFGHALEELEEMPLADVRGEADLVLHGWLELLWEPARGLVICGAGDEHLPGVVSVDAFLPDKAREKLGLACQSRRRARDAYLLRAMWEQRRVDDGLHIIFGRVNADGDALRPSRLLLDCQDNDLPARVRHLFPDDDNHSHAGPRPARTSAFQLRPGPLKWKGDHTSPSQIRDYLACPFRFYLKRVLGLQSRESGQREMSPPDFGSLMHDVLRAFAHGPMAHSQNAEEIARCLIAELDRLAITRFGAEPLFSVALQIESMRQRLRKFAGDQAGLRAGGWKILAAEEVITPDWGIMIGEVVLSGTIDRIDRHEKTGALRVIDYKTSQTGKGPAAAHLKKAKAGDLENESISWQCFSDANGKALRWVDLQLPLYAMAVAKKHPEASSVDACYIALPATVEDIKLMEWNGEKKAGVQWNEELLHSANQCAEEAVRRMSEGIFWPPSEDVKYDAYEEMLLGDARAAVMEPDSWGAAP